MQADLCYIAAGLAATIRRCSFEWYGFVHFSNSTAILMMKPDMLRSSPRQADTQRPALARPPRPAVPTTTPSSAPSAAPQTSHELARAVLAQASSPEARQRQQLESSVRQARNDARADLERQAIRRWKVGDVYAPHDLTGLEMAKWKKLRRKGKLKWDVVDLLGINPIDHYKVSDILILPRLRY